MVVAVAVGLAAADPGLGVALAAALEAGLAADPAVGAVGSAVLSLSLASVQGSVGWRPAYRLEKIAAGAFAVVAGRAAVAEIGVVMASEPALADLAGPAEPAELLVPAGLAEPEAPPSEPGHHQQLVDPAGPCSA